MNQISDDLDREAEQFLAHRFDENYELLRLDSGRGLSPDGRATALQQILHYWRKLRDVAVTITDTEVRLCLTNQETPHGRPFAIEGVVDIVRERDRIVMYDIKTHDATYVRENKDLYVKQLNVYAHVWETLRQERLDEASVIATVLPEELVDALEAGDQRRIAEVLNDWEPVVPLDYDAERVRETVAEFGEVVDGIEQGAFTARTPDELKSRQGLSRQRFATAVCRNCDARFSCSSYREYALAATARAEQTLSQFYGDLSTDIEREARRTANLSAAPDIDDLAANFIERG